MRSEQIKTGVERTPNRSLLYALGYTDEELARPLIGVVSSYNEIVPGHMGLDKIAEAVKAGIRAAGGTPVKERMSIWTRAGSIQTVSPTERCPSPDWQARSPG